MREPCAPRTENGGLVTGISGIQSNKRTRLILETDVKTANLSKVHWSRVVEAAFAKKNE